MSGTLEAPERVFPLSRHLSWRVTRVLAKYPISPNQITATAIVPGLACAWCLASGRYWLGVAGALFFVVYYTLDCVDGEIARLKGQTSTFGDQLDTFADWLVHAAFFAALGFGTARADGEELWLWLGWAAAAGCTIDYVSRIVTGMRPKRASAAPQPGQAAGEGETRKARFIYVFRVLVRTDFCFIVAALAVIDATWLLLPAGAVGAQVYWILRFFR